MPVTDYLNERKYGNRIFLATSCTCGNIMLGTVLFKGFMRSHFEGYTSYAVHEFNN